MTVKISPQPWLQFLDANGDPYASGQLFVYAAGSTTKQTPYTDNTETSQHTNPIILNSKGIPPSPIWLVEGLSYKFVLAPSGDTDPPASAIATYDNLRGVNDADLTIDQWQASGLTPTFVNTTTFTVPGDQTTELHVGRRLKLSVTAGTVYGTIATTAYTSLTTVTVTLDSGSIDSGISAVSWGLVTYDNTSLPTLPDNSVDSDMYVDGSIDTAHIADNQVTLAKMAGGTAGHLISYDSSADPQTETYFKWYQHASSPIDLTNSGANDTASWTFGSIPSSVIMMKLVLVTPSLANDTEIVCTLGDAGGEETSGYSGGSKLVNASGGNWVANSTYFQLTNSANSGDTIDVIKAAFEELSGNLWSMDAIGVNTSDTNLEVMAGAKTLTAELTQLIVKSSAGANFDGGTAYLYLYGNADV